MNLCKRRLQTIILLFKHNIDALRKNDFKQIPSLPSKISSGLNRLRAFWKLFRCTSSGTIIFDLGRERTKKFEDSHGEYEIATVLWSTLFSRHTQHVQDKEHIANGPILLGIVTRQTGGLNAFF